MSFIKKISNKMFLLKLYGEESPTKVVAEEYSEIPNGFVVYPGMLVPPLYVGIFNPETQETGIVKESFVPDNMLPKFKYSPERNTFVRISDAATVC